MNVGFDFDGTLVESWTATPLPGVRERLAELPMDTRTFIATNQAGPVWRQMTGEARYPTCEDVAQRIIAGLAALDWRPDLLLICVHPGRDDATWHDATNGAGRALSDLLRGISPRSVSAWPSDRKPAAGMLISGWGILGEKRPPILYIGDMDTDQQAASAAGCRYLDAAVWRERGLDDENLPDNARP